MEKVKFVNLTNHTYFVKSPEGEVKISPSGKILPKIKYDRNGGTIIEKVPIYNTKVKRIDNLPAPEQGVIFIVFPPIKRVARDYFNRLDCVSAIKAKELEENVFECEGFSS